MSKPSYALRKLFQPAVPQGSSRVRAFPRSDEFIRLLLTTLTTALCALLFAPGVAQAARGHEFSKTFGKACEATPCPGGQLNEPAGVAINESSGDVYVVDKGDSRVERFNSAGAYETEFNGSGTNAWENGAAPTGRFLNPHGIAIDNACHLHKPELTEATTPTCKEYDPSNGDVYVADLGHRVVDKFSPDGEYVYQIVETPAGPLSGLQGVAVDNSGHLWVLNGSHPDELIEFTNEVTNVFVPPIRSSNVTLFAQEGLAVDSEGNFYEINGSGSEEPFAYKLDSAGKVLLGPLDEEGTTAVAVEPTTDDSYIDNETTVARFSPAGELLERLGSGQLTKGGENDKSAGIGINSAAEIVYVSNPADEIDIFTPEPPGPSTIESESASEVTSDSATLSAEINPRGEPTEYHFEYDTSEYAPDGPAHGTSVPLSDASIGFGFESQEVHLRLQGLTPRKAYHFRVVAHSKLGTVDGLDHAFVTQPAGGEFGLPDGRLYELVSPPDTQGAVIDPIGLGLLEAAENGTAITYLAEAPLGSNPAGNPEYTQVMSSRAHGGGWMSQDIATPHEVASGVTSGDGQEYRFASPTLSLALLEPLGETPLSSLVSERTLYIRADAPISADAAEMATYDEVAEEVSRGHSSPPGYLPLVTDGNVPQGTHYAAHTGALAGLEFVDATPDMSHVVFRSQEALTPNAIKNTHNESEESLYEWTAGHLGLVSVMPNGSPATEPEPADPEISLSAMVGDQNQNVRNAISADGSRVVWETVGRGEENHLYMRDTESQETIQIDAPQAGAGSGAAHPRFQAANTHATRIFFTDTQQLTVGSTAEPGGVDGGGDLYECEVSEVASKLACRLKDLTVDHVGGESAHVLGTVLGVSEDGSWVYFVAEGALASGAGRAADNLYVAHEEDSVWTTKFIATLSKQDSLNDWAVISGVGADLGRLTARVSPNGRYLTFVSHASLTGYDNRDVNSDERDTEVYLFDSEAEEKGRPSLVCVSCNPTGARPVGMFDTEGRPLFDRARALDKQWVAGSIPGWTPMAGAAGTALYQSRYLSNEGRLFFDSEDALVPQDTNGVEDVYEYEPEGEGSCTSASETFSSKVAGCVGLISRGTSSEESTFLDASTTGDDVFFLTSAKLVPGNSDSGYHVYDAHVCGAEGVACSTVAASPPPCVTADSCRAAPTSQPAIFGAPPSATFSGDGDLTPEKPTPSKRTGKEKLKRALRTCDAKHRHSRQERRLCRRRVRSRFVQHRHGHKHAHTSRRRTKTGSGRRRR